MRKLIASEFISLDGVVESPEKWYPTYWSEDAQKYKDAEQSAAGTLLLGRKTYEAFAATWPSRSGALADNINQIGKVVVSSTVNSPAWKNTTIIEDNLEASIRKLVAQPGKDILTVGSASLVRSLLEMDLLDELRLIVSPVVLGTGVRLFGSNSAPIRLKLTGSQLFQKGVILLVYQKERV